MISDGNLVGALTNALGQVVLGLVGVGRLIGGV